METLFHLNFELGNLNFKIYYPLTRTWTNIVKNSTNLVVKTASNDFRNGVTRLKKGQQYIKKLKGEGEGGV